MQYIHIWQVKATLKSTRTNTTYDVDTNVVTIGKSFSEADKAGLELVKKIVQDEKSHCEFEGLDEINYIGLGGTLINGN
ncbi:hypothetical protein LCM23_25255 [Cytobacillus kochii]|uniref:hypothetical protein n=1 Tax=Cytobacillus kochii TaxID=859143 RepID=UPI001CD49142|nr:hypothetical protein [Cytobacillus kochii]MCA1029324.1 hypothetical protein [Cytobacillus kochii]